MFAYFNIRTLAAGLVGLALFVAPAKAQEDTAEKTIVEIAQGSDQFSTLVKALKAADLVGALQGDGPFTVFAPTNAAFDKLPDGKLESLLEEGNKSTLQAILKYHVVAAKAPASKVAGMSEAETLQGMMVGIQAGDDGVQLMGKNSAMVTSTDVMASNGVIHVIDTVLLPPEEKMDKDTEDSSGGGYK
jgi:uncharacterized surface protein with fasciclin (FAS1) repeats